tara:strand:+ start:1416 stop:2126 length:711 start_codon:yes stop_codon:yes gene_type:complete
MPVDPRTGQNLPYPGEPGYEEALRANPEAYMEMAQGMQGGGEMMPQDDGMMGQDPSMMGGEGMMPQGAPPSPDEITSLEQEEAMLDQQIMSQAAPQPETAFSVDAINTLLSEFNNTLDKFAGEDIPDIEWTGSEGGKKWDQPLPTEVFSPLVALNDTLELVDDGKYANKYAIDLEALTSDAELRKATASLKKMANDKKLVEAMQQPATMPGPQGGGMPPAPGDFDQEEQMLAANMG